MKKQKSRCSWCEKEDIYINYHDKEWGRPVKNDQVLFEFLVLESFQAGLSWLTVLKKRENFRKAFKNFDVVKVSKMNQKDVERLMQDAGIIRNRLKIEATINNAKRFIEIQKEFGSFAKYAWSFVDGKTIVNKLKKLSDLPAKTPTSDKMSEDMGKRGFKFRGSTICYAFMQACGLVNDHLVTCFLHPSNKSK